MQLNQTNLIKIYANYRTVSVEVMAFFKLYLVVKNLFSRYVLLRITNINLKYLALTNWLQAQPPAVKSQVATIGSVTLQEKIGLLEGNVESLLKKDQSINEEIKAVKSNVNSVQTGLANQIRQINVCNIQYVEHT